LSPAWIVGLSLLSLALSGVLAAVFVAGTPLASSTTTLLLIAVPFVLVIGFLIAAICGYMAGLIGASNSPISGVGILSIVSCATILVVAIHPTEATRPALVAFALFVTSIIVACATISNDNLQDLKTGQLVGASPRRQQIALIVGVIAGALVTPLVLNLLAKSNGFAGAPNVGVIAQNPLPAPQATLISALARGVIGGDLDWKMIGIGLLVGLGVVVIDETLGLLKRLRIPPLAIGIGIYLPMSATFAVIVGSIVGHWYNGRVKGRPQADRLERVGVLVASGLIVGESLFGVLNSGLIVATNKEAPLALAPADFFAGRGLGVLAFIALIVVLYRWMLGRGRTD
jgi:putative OPT family oligopeptide transporter